MPVALILAFAASFGIHALALFGPDVDLSTEPESPILLAELKPIPKTLVATEKPEVRPARSPVRKKPTRPPVLSEQFTPSATQEPKVPAVPDELENIAESPGPAGSELPSAPQEVASQIPPRLPEYGQIRYRVERGDQGFEIGRATSDWEIHDDSYILRLTTETSGLVWLFKAYRIDMESRGRLTAGGLQPESFSIRRNGAETNEKAEFDWTEKLIRVGDGAPQALSPGAQDLLSFNFHLGFMPESSVARVLPITTGKKYGMYRLEILGDEVVEIPAGTLRTLHLRAPGVNTTELWLAYDYLLLPVKIRHEDKKGNSLVQVATEIRFGTKQEN